jgi:hypothetical protein
MASESFVHVTKNAYKQLYEIWLKNRESPDFPKI